MSAAVCKGKAVAFGSDTGTVVLIKLIFSSIPLKCTITYDLTRLFFSLLVIDVYFSNYYSK